LELIWGCAAGVKNQSKNPAENRYEQALRELDLGMFSEAIAGFNEVKTKYPYSNYAALSDLRLADSHFEQAKYIEAADAYRNFLRFHPNHSDGDYAMLRIGECYYEKIPSDWWLLPPSEEKDQEATKQALRAFKDMIKAYPKSQYIENAKESVKSCQQKLAKHGFYVANFYFQKKEYVATKMRVDFLLNNFSGLGLDQQALWLLAKIQQEENNIKGLGTTLKKIITIDSKTDLAKKAKALQSND
tara:strand:- start:214 stop:945 length:732 start_codon:yes stop_codon:yes gene_type:complete